MCEHDEERVALRVHLGPEVLDERFAKHGTMLRKDGRIGVLQPLYELGRAFDIAE